MSPRTSRRSPKREAGPLDEYSTWNVRIARAFYFSFVAASGIAVVGIWVTILAALDPKIWEQYLSLDLGYQIAIIAGFVTAHLIILV
ncbi:MAG: hypothetical protein EU539_09480, partial [Promethearchaeota archaeon]